MITEIHAYQDLIAFNKSYRSSVIPMIFKASEAIEQSKDNPDDLLDSPDFE